jgi:hypothetical protein
MPELIFAAPLAVAFLALLVIFRQERLSREAGEPPNIHPFRLGMYRGCAFLGFLFFLYVAAFVIIGLLSGPRT